MTKIVSHNDIDGIVSAALASHATGIGRAIFIHPHEVEDHIEPGDYLFDLPYSSKASLWIDHHESQIERVKNIKYTGILNPDAVCAAVLVKDYFHISGEPWESLTQFAVEADSFNFNHEPSFLLSVYISIRPDQKMYQALFNSMRRYGTKHIFSIPEIKTRKQIFDEIYRKNTEKAMQQAQEIRRGILLIDATDISGFSTKYGEMLAYRQGYISLAILRRIDKKKIKVSINTNPLMNIKEINCSKIAEKLGVSRQRVHQIIKMCVKKLQKEWKEMKNEKLVAIGKTISGLSHDIRNILTNLEGGINLLEIGLADKDMEVIESAGGMIKRSYEKMKDLVLSMIDYSKERELDLKLTDLNGLIEENISSNSEIFEENKINYCSLLQFLL